MGRRLGEKAVPGQVFTLIGRSWSGQRPFLPRGLRKAWGFRSRSAVLHLRLSRCMKKGGFPSIILTSTGSEMWRRWKKSGFEDYVMGDGVSLIEWADLIRGDPPGRADGVGIKGSGTGLRLQKDYNQRAGKIVRWCCRREGGKLSVSVTAPLRAERRCGKRRSRLQKNQYESIGDRQLRADGHRRGWWRMTGRSRSIRRILKRRIRRRCCP